MYLYHKSLAVLKSHEIRCCVRFKRKVNDNFIYCKYVNIPCRYSYHMGFDSHDSKGKQRAAHFTQIVYCGQEKLGIGKTIPSWRSIQKRSIKMKEKNAHCLSKSTEWVCVGGVMLVVIKQLVDDSEILLPILCINILVLVVNRFQSFDIFFLYGNKLFVCWFFLTCLQFRYCNGLADYNIVVITIGSTCSIRKITYRL